MKISEKTLKDLQEKNTFVDIFTDYYELSLLGFIKKFNQNFLLLEHYNEDGFYNGIVVFKRQDITRIRWDNNEINSTFKIINKVESVEEISDVDISSIESVINSVNKTFGYVSIHLQGINEDWIIIGQVQEIDKESIVIKEYGTKISLDRSMLMFSVADITRVDADGLYEKNLMKIHKTNNKY